MNSHDGLYSIALISGKGDVVHGFKRRANSFNTQRVDHIYQVQRVDNASFMLHIVQEAQPDEIYNLRSQSQSNFAQNDSLGLRLNMAGTKPNAH